MWQLPHQWAYHLVSNPNGSFAINPSISRDSPPAPPFPPSSLTTQNYGQASIPACDSNMNYATSPPPPPKKKKKVNDTFLYYSRQLVPSKLIKSKHKSSFYYFNMRGSFTLALFAFSAISSVLADKYLYVSLAISFLLHLTKRNSAFEVHSQFCTAPRG